MSAEAVAEAIRSRRTFLLTSHARPDGDSIGSQLAMAYALDALGKQVRIVNADAAPSAYEGFAGMDRIEILPKVEGDYDGLIVMECGDLTRPGVEGLDGRFTINIDHHIGNTGYGDVNWFDEQAAACTEMVYMVIQALGVSLTREMALHLYLGVLTDTGSFRHGSMSARTFEIARACVAAGVDPAATARQVFDSNSIGKLRLIGSMLDAMQLEAGGRVAVLRMSDALLEATGATMDDTEGLINMPLTARHVQAVILIKTADGGRVSLRSKGAIDVRSVAVKHGGGGHKNAAGLTLEGPTEVAERALIEEVVAVVQASGA
ncbi:MAG: bifunctional oligoribonuclease/PAP phosphatase NrnA [Acidobacteria bacterium]|nr:bifunctional oligoribonuclease/PAP phosphatase NrnA [Acidobacteriota bacterium]